MIQATTIKNFCIWLILLFSYSCQTPLSIKKTVGSPPNITLLPPPLNTATLVNIKNDWNGYSDITPIVRHYKFKPKAGGMSGNGHFAVGGYGAYNIRQQHTKKINISAAITQQFFKKLGETKMQTSSGYQPTRNRSDDYPAITIQITTPQQEVTFFSSSQGKNYTPWQIKTNKGIYISNSAAPTAALAILKPYIDHPGLEQVISKRRLSPPPQPQAKKNRSQ